MNKCIGCGIKLQNISKDKIGYTNKLDNLYCERCFKTIHYNEERKVNNIDNNKIINKINKIGYYTIFITDLISINNKLINIYKSINNEKILVINKCDIIPNNLKLEHIIDNIKNSYNIKEDIIFISAKNKLYINKIIDIINNKNNIILCGETSSGKSTLINNIFNTKLTTSKYNNTTLDFIKLKYLNNIIYDTPGIIINNKKIYNKLIINTKQLNNNYILSIDNIKIRVNGNLTLIIPDDIKISSKKDNTKLDYKININNNSDILLDNGFIFIKDNCIIESNKELEIRKSIIGK